MKIRITENQFRQLASSLLLEDRESKAMKDAVDYLIQNGQSPDNAKNIFNAIRNDIPSVRLPLYTNNNGKEKGSYKFARGVERMYLNGELNDGSVVMKLNKTLKLLANGHADEYDNNLNGLSAEELNTRFEGAAKQDLENDMNDVASETYTNNGYKVVRIPDPETAAEYGKYTLWCVTHDEDMYDSYTSNGIGLFYFFLKDGFENVKEVEGEGCPLDEYGLSMIAVSINMDGSINTVTCRWNHDNGGNDNIMNAKELSRVVGMNVYDVCKPYTRDELHAKGIILFDEVQGLLDSGKKPEEIFDNINPFYNGFARVLLNGKYSFIDETNKLIGDGNQWFDYAWDFNDGFARVDVNGKQSFIDKEGKLIGDGNLWFDWVGSFEEGLAIAILNGKQSFIDKNGELIGDGNLWFDEVGVFSKKGLAIVKLNHKYSLIDKNGNLIGNGNLWFDEASNVYNGFAIVRLNGKRLYVDEQGNLYDENKKPINKPMNESLNKSLDLMRRIELLN